jgi:hypothetical protein
MLNFTPENREFQKSPVKMMNLFFVLLIVNTACSDSEVMNNTISVSAGEFDRSEAVVMLPIPGDVNPGIYQMFSVKGTHAILQVDETNIGWFILDNLAAGDTDSFTFTDESGIYTSEKDGVIHLVNDNTISFQTGDKKIFSYFFGENDPPAELDERYRRGGYIHPVYSPNGIQLTNHLNIDQHPHQLGIWSAWTRTEYQGRNPDFWNFHNDSGRVEGRDTLIAAWKGPVHGGFRGMHYFWDLTSGVPDLVLNEEWEARVYPAIHDEKYLVFDISITQSANTDSTLKLLEYHYGGLAFRGHADWDNPENVNFLTSEGLNRDGNATRARWTHIGGYSNGNLAGITIMDHPENVRHPQPVRIHPEMAYFNYAPTQLGELSIEPGSPYKAVYRFITYDGSPDPAELDRMWHDFAYPPTASVQRE